MRAKPIALIAVAATALTGVALTSTAAFSDPLGFAGPFQSFRPAIQQALPEPEAEADVPAATEMSPRLRRQIVNYPTREAVGTVIIDTPNTYLYYVLGQGRAIRYGIGVGREGFTWAGTQSIARKQEWPDWYPPAEMIARQPYLPRMMSGGPGNPLGARAMYLGNTQYRIHGTNAPDTIGKRVSSGCIRMLNDDVVDLYEHVNVGAKVVVLPMRSADMPSPSVQDRPVHPVRAAVSSDRSAYRIY